LNLLNLYHDLSKHLKRHILQIKDPLYKPTHPKEPDQNRDCKNYAAFINLPIEPSNEREYDRYNQYLAYFYPDIEGKERGNQTARRQPQFSKNIGKTKTVY